MVPDQQSGAHAARGQVVAAPGEQLGRERTDRLAYGAPQPELLGGAGVCPHQQAITRERFRGGIIWCTRFFDQPQGWVGGGPGVHWGLGHAAPPHCIRKAQRPVGVCGC